MVQYKYLCGVSGGRDLVYKDTEGVCASAHTLCSGKKPTGSVANGTIHVYHLKGIPSFSWNKNNHELKDHTQGHTLHTALEETSQTLPCKPHHFVVWQMGSNVLWRETTSASSEQTTLYPEDGGSRFLKTLGTHLPKYMVPHPRKPTASWSLPWESKISHHWNLFRTFPKQFLVRFEVQ